MSMCRLRASCLSLRPISLRCTISSGQNLTPARIRSDVRYCSYTSTVLVTTACVGTTCVANLTCRLAVIKNPTFRKLSCIILPKKRRMQSFIASPMKSAWSVLISTLWFIATRLMRRCRRRRISPRITLIALARKSRRIWPKWQKSWSVSRSRC
ncbi:hypothetical protein D3C73_1336450 [compost metagenome]